MCVCVCVCVRTLVCRFQGKHRASVIKILCIHAIRVASLICSNITFNFLYNAIQHSVPTCVILNIYTRKNASLFWEWLGASLNLVVPTREGTQSLLLSAHTLV